MWTRKYKSIVSSRQLFFLFYEKQPDAWHTAKERKKWGKLEKKKGLAVGSSASF